MHKTEILAFCQSWAELVVEEMKVLMNVLQFTWKKEWRTRWMSSNRAINWLTIAQSRRDSCSWVHTQRVSTQCEPPH